MNKALLSSKNMNWCTPQKFYDELNEEFHFVLDPAATDETAKCSLYYTPETDGLSQSWDCGGAVFAIRHTDARSANGSKKHTRNREKLSIR